MTWFEDLTCALIRPLGSMTREHRICAYLPILLAGTLAIVGCHRRSNGSRAVPETDAAPAVLDAGRAFDVPDVRGPERRLATLALQALLEGYGIQVAPDVLDRESKLAPDGASIDDIEEVAKTHGLNAEQLMLPRDAVLLPESEALPCLVIVEDESRAKQIFLAWRADGDLVQVLDPVRGRQTISRGEFLAHLFIHEMAIPADSWRSYADGDAFKSILRARMARLGVPRLFGAELIADSGRDRSMQGRAALDAALRQLEWGSAEAGRSTVDQVRERFDCAYNHSCKGNLTPPPPSEWTARSGPLGDGGVEQVILRGAVLVRVSGRR
jgi:hypothetical protein